MPQELNVLCCYSCKMYQVHIVKKEHKWQCKLCNAKQSIQQIYFQGSGKDCRARVQWLNSLKANEIPLCPMASEQDDKDDNHNTSANVSQESRRNEAVNSKWTKYLDSSEVEDSSNMKTYAVENTSNDSCNFINMLDDIDFDTEF